ncbi:MAG: hypothetical protein ABUS48_04740 [Pseudomonadota bacterium]
MRTLWLIAPLLALAACGQNAGQQAPASSAQSAAAAGDACVAQATRDWMIGAARYRLDASGHGPSCAQAEATITIRAPDNSVLFTQNYRTSDISLSFNPRGDQQTLNDDLNSWIENQAPGATASSLPPWPQGAEAPPQFRPAVTRDVYEAARSGGHALFCYPDDGETNACVAIDTNAHHGVLLGSRLFEH